MFCKFRFSKRPSQPSFRSQSLCSIRSSQRYGGSVSGDHRARTAMQDYINEQFAGRPWKVRWSIFGIRSSVLPFAWTPFQCQTRNPYGAVTCFLSRLRGNGNRPNLRSHSGIRDHCSRWFSQLPTALFFYGYLCGRCFSPTTRR